MNEKDFTTLLSITFAFLGAAVACSIWTKVAVELMRHRLFTIRAKLFDAALEASAFDDDAYREMRLVINGLLRSAHTMRGVRWLHFVSKQYYSPDSSNKRLIDPSKSKIPVAIVEARCDVVNAFKFHLWLSRIDGAVVMLLLTIGGRLNKIIQAVFIEAEKVGRDDEYAKATVVGVWRLPKPIA